MGRRRGAQRRRCGHAAGRSSPPAGSGEPDFVFRFPKRRFRPRGNSQRLRLIKNPFPEDRFAEKSELRPGNSAVVHHLRIDVEAPGRSFGGKRRPDWAGRESPARRVAVARPTSRGDDSERHHLIAGSGRTLREVPPGHREAHRRRSLHPVQHALPAERHRHDRPVEAGDLVGQRPRHARSLHEGRRHVAADRAQRDALHRRGPGNRRQLGQWRGRSARRRRAQGHSEHPAVRGKLEDHRRDTDYRTDHGVRDVAAHAPPGQGPDVDRHLARRPSRDPAQRAEVRFQLAAELRAQDPDHAAGRQQDHRNRALRQLGVEPVQPRSRQGSVLGGAELGQVFLPMSNTP